MRAFLRVQRRSATPFLYAVDLSCVLGFVDVDYWLIFYLVICTDWEQLPAPWLQEVPAVAQWLRGVACSCVVARMQQLRGWDRSEPGLRGCEDSGSCEAARICRQLRGRLPVVASTAQLRGMPAQSSRRWQWQFAAPLELPVGSSVPPAHRIQCRLT